jgi:hypothetical protein
MDKENVASTLWSIIQQKKRMKLCQVKENDGTGAHHVKPNKPDSERHIACFLSYAGFRSKKQKGHECKRGWGRRKTDDEKTVIEVFCMRV